MRHLYFGILAATLLGCSSSGDGISTPGGPEPGTNGDRSNGDAGNPGNTPTPAVATVRVHYAVGKHALGLRGELAPLSWDAPTPLKSIGNDTWEYSLGPLDAPVAVAPSLDNTRSRGPNYVVKPGQTLDIYPHFFVEKGTIELLVDHFESKVHPFPTPDGRPPIFVYLPPTYQENMAARFPVIYMMDGQIVFGDPLVGVVMGDLKVDETLDAAAESGEIAETIVVSIDSPLTASLDPSKLMEDRNHELTPTSADAPEGGITKAKSGLGPKYLEMVVTEIKPLVDTRLRTRPERESTFIGGASLGGLMSVYAGVTRGDTFGGIISMSASAFWDSNFVVEAVKNAKIGAKQTSKAYADIGGNETSGDSLMLKANDALFKAYEEAGYVKGSTLKTLVVPQGTHHGDSWQKQIPSALAFIVGPGR